MRRASMVALVVLSAALTALAQGPPPLLLPADMEDTDYQIFVAALDAFPAAGAVTVVDEVTLTGGRLPDLPEVERGPGSDFVARNGRSYRLLPLFEGIERFRVIASSDVTSYTKNAKRWRKFAARYPEATGIFAVSRPGFDRGGRRALVRVVHRPDWRHRKEGWALLSRTDGGWRVERWLWASGGEAGGPEPGTPP